VLLTYKPNQGFSIPSALGIQTKCCTSPLKIIKQVAGRKKHSEEKMIANSASIQD
jgi:hypothetical protein